MGLRLRLFLWVGSLFFSRLFHIVSLGTARYKSESGYKRSKISKMKIVQLNEKKRHYIELFLRDALANEQARINVLLDKVAENQVLLEGFEPTIENLVHQTWLNSALLCSVNRWVDFIQNTNQGDLSSMITVDADKIEVALRVPVEENIALVVVKEKKTADTWKGPYIGVRLQYGRFLLDDEAQTAQTAHLSRARFALFPIKNILNLNIDEINLQNLNRRLQADASFPFLMSETATESYARAFVANLRKAQDYLRKHYRDLPPPSNPKELHLWVHRHLAEDGRLTSPTEWSLEIAREKALYGEEIDKDISAEIIQLLDRYDEIDMVWGLSSLMATGIFGFFSL